LRPRIFGSLYRESDFPMIRTSQMRKNLG
jgi:hypothetical protein